MNQILPTLLLLLLIAPPVLLAITVHEAAHGWVANRRGDPTAFLMGRVTFNPLRHIDPVGTILVPAVIFLTSKALVGVPFLFGWAKPVPVDWRRLRNPRWDMALVAAAGPLVNLLMAFAWGLAIKAMALVVTVVAVPTWFLQLFVEMCVVGIIINLVLMALNLFPLLPLDGGRILNALLPPPLALRFSRLERYGIIILMALLFLPNGNPPGLLGAALRPVVSGVLTVIPGSALVRDRFPI
ncbi:MAG: site-2 protease family protein [Thiohalocapsa sp.]|jgi:Zn-dependent protease|uniref:site-2 protease family protein n=1 Tax=Thiohalocapsa sp. TaxID=2497641 RepID=UPI0025D3C631|nr:site-2 protease family protein [Thiohalocapsa sp.]MCG6942398.1 site-2 protease family protein [Thiohalocapsa sp.]